MGGDFGDCVVTFDINRRGVQILRGFYSARCSEVQHYAVPIVSAISPNVADTRKCFCFEQRCDCGFFFVFADVTAGRLTRTNIGVPKSESSKSSDSEYVRSSIDFSGGIESYPSSSSSANRIVCAVPLGTHRFVVGNVCFPFLFFNSFFKLLFENVFDFGFFLFFFGALGRQFFCDCSGTENGCSKRLKNLSST